jgi:hypothetical protein
MGRAGILEVQPCPSIDSSIEADLDNDASIMQTLHDRLLQPCGNRFWVCTVDAGSVGILELPPHRRCSGPQI